MFKSGDWVIRKWNQEWHSSIDFARVDSHLKNGFISNLFFRFGYNDNEDYNQDLSWEANRLEIEYKDDESRMEFNWRKATKDEIENYVTLSTLTNKIEI